jgi:two-component system, OmpR family, KDP operon response regulator KdpE
MSDGPLILIIEDEEPIRRFLRASLSVENYRLAEAERGEQGVHLATQQPPDLVILDLGLPDLDGQEVLRRLREWLQAPIIVLSARNQEREKVAALDHGADDYLTKPFAVGELLARIRVALRHAARIGAEPGETTFCVGELQVDLARRQVIVRGQQVHLTPIEYRLLVTLTKHAGKVLTHQHLLKEGWGPNESRETHYLRVYMNQLRHKIELDPHRPRYLLTEPGVGYRLADE